MILNPEFWNLNPEFWNLNHEFWNLSPDFWNLTRTSASLCEVALERHFPKSLAPGMRIKKCVSAVPVVCLKALCSVQLATGLEPGGIQILSQSTVDQHISSKSTALSLCPL